MSDAKLALDELRKGLRIFRAFEHAESVLELVQSSEQRVAEAKLQLDMLTPKVDAARAEHNNLLTQIEGARVLALETLSAAKVQAGKIISDAHDKVRKEVDAEVVRLKAVRDNHDTLVEQARAQVDALGVEQATLAVEVKDLEARAEKARAYIAKLKE